MTFTYASQTRIPNVTAHYADVSDPTSVDACLAEVIQQHGKIDNLVC
jgi:D-arabinitol 2-dehydrogenase